MNKPGPKPKPEHEKFKFMAARVPFLDHKAAEDFRKARGWNESEFIRYAVNLAINSKPPKRFRKSI